MAAFGNGARHDGLFLALYLKATRNEILRRRVRTLRTLAVAASAGLPGQPAE